MDLLYAKNVIGKSIERRGYDMGSFIKIDRKIVKWEWWSDINTFRLFFYMLITAYWKDGNYKGKPIPRGSFPSSVSELSKETNLTENEIRTALKHLKSTGEITSKSTNKFTVFSVKKYDLYQSDNKQNYEQITSQNTNELQTDNEQLTNKSQTNNEQLTNSILKENKNIKNVNNVKNEKKKEYTCGFEQVWKMYPRKIDKGGAYRCYQARLNAGFTEEELAEATKNYADECLNEKREIKYIKHASTFFGSSTPFVDYLNKSNGNSRGDVVNGQVRGSYEQDTEDDEEEWNPIWDTLGTNGRVSTM